MPFKGVRTTDKQDEVFHLIQYLTELRELKDSNLDVDDDIGMVINRLNQLFDVEKGDKKNDSGIDSTIGFKE